MPAVESRVRVRYAETDQMGVVYHANYLVWMEVGRVEYWRASGLRYRDMEQDGILVVVAEANCRYQSPAFYDEEVLIRTTLGEANPRMVRFDYALLGAEDARTIATGYTKHVFCGRDRRPMKLPEKYHGALGLSTQPPSTAKESSIDDALLPAISGYDYPPVTYDFVSQREIRFPTMRELDEYHYTLLHGPDARSVKDGLSGVLYWGFYRTGYRNRRVERFRNEVTSDQLDRAIKVFSASNRPNLRDLAKLGLPQFSGMAFVSKLRTFLDPDHYCVLDSKIASLRPLQTRLAVQKTSIPVTTGNEAAYTWWVNVCQTLASRVHTKPAIRPVDVERGFYYLLDHGQREKAEELLRSAEKDG